MPRAVKGEAAARRERALRDWHFVLSDERGRRVIQELYEATGYDSETPTGHAELLVWSGRRHIGQVLREAVKAINPQLFALMAEEYAERPEMPAERQEDDVLG